MAAASESSNVFEELMQLEEDLVDFASRDHLGNVFLKAIGAMKDLVERGADSDIFAKDARFFNKSVKKEQVRDDKNDPLRDAGYLFCQALALTLTEISQKARADNEKRESARTMHSSRLSQNSHQPHQSQPIQSADNNRKKKPFIMRRVVKEEERVDAPVVEPLRLSRCGDCGDIFKTQNERQEHQKVHAIEAPPIAEPVMTRAARKRKGINNDEDVAVNPRKSARLAIDHTARLAIEAPPSTDEMSCPTCHKEYKTKRWLNKHIEDKKCAM